MRALVEQVPELDVVRLRDIGLAQATDRPVLEWAAGEARILLPHDRDTMPGYAYARVRAGLPMPGVIEVPAAMATGRLIHDLALLVAGCVEGELEG